MWLNYDKINFNQFNSRPTYRVMDVFTADMIGKSVGIINTHYLYM